MDLFFPRRVERPLYGQFVELTQILVHATDAHSRLLGNGYRERSRILPGLHENATRATELCGRIANRLAESLITPYESELLYEFALTVADTIDSLEHTSELLVLTRVGTLPTPLLEAAKGIERAAELTLVASWSLSRINEIEDYYTQVRKIRRQGDRLMRQALAELYRRGGASSDLLAFRDVTSAIGRTIELQERSARLADLLRVKDA